MNMFLRQYLADSNCNIAVIAAYNEEEVDRIFKEHFPNDDGVVNITEIIIPDTPKVILKL